MKDETRLWLDSLSPSVNDSPVLQQHVGRPATLSDAASWSNNIPLLIAWIRAVPLRTPTQIEQFLQQVLRIAICYERLDTVRFLMQYLSMECLQTILSKEDDTFASPLHHAIHRESLPIIRCVFETYPAALHQKYKSHLSPFQFALLFNKYAITHYFLDTMPDPIKQDTLKNAFHYVSSYEMATHLHQLNPRLIDQLSGGLTTAYSAISHYNYDVLRFILHLRPNLMTLDLLFWAATKKHIAAIELMLSLKPNVLGTDESNDENVLHIVARYIHKPQLIADVLVHCSHYIEQCDRFNCTPYNIAVRVNNRHAIDAYELYVSVDVVFNTYARSWNVENMDRVFLKVKTQCIVLDTLLLPELNAIVQSYIKI